MVDVTIETGAKRVFASAVDWPGWARSATTEDAAIEALGAYARRYAIVAAEAGVRFPQTRLGFEVVERLPGSTSTDFGVPGAIGPLDERRLTAARATRIASLVEAAWAVFDRVVAGAPAVLAKGPRGGGRDRDQIVDHVLEAERVYARKLGVRLPAVAPGDRAAVEANRAALLDALRSARSGERHEPKGWPPPYVARRVAWHVTDHAWEIEDKS